jgi:receptor expression-enhancing protein 5/6
MDKVKEYMNRCTAHFDQIPKFKMVADKVGVPSGYIAVALLVLAMFLVFSDLGSRVICDLVGVVYPAYISFKAVESPGADDDK